MVSNQSINQPSPAAQALAERGLLCQEQKDYGKAVDWYRRALEVYFQWPEVHYNLGFVLEKLGYIEEAIASYRQGIIHKPNYTNAYYNLGLILQKQGREMEAIAAYQNAIYLEPETPMAYSNLGGILVGRGEYKTALEILGTALKKWPQTASLHNNLGRSLLGKQDWDRAIAAFLKAVQLQPDSAIIQHNLGKALQQQGSHIAALDCFQKVLILAPEFPGIHSDLAWSLMELADFPEAIAHLKEAIKGQEFLLTAYITESEKQAVDGSLGEAQKACAQLLQALNQNDISVSVITLAQTYFHLGQALAEYQNFGSAEQYYQKTLKLQPDFTAAHLAWGDILREQGRLKEAQKHYNQSLELLTAEPETSPPLSQPIPSIPELPAADPDLPACQGLDCYPCLQPIIENFAPQQLGSHQYKLKPPAPLPLCNPTGKVTILPQGRAIVDPRRNWWKVCNATAIINAEGEMLPQFSRFYPTPLPGCRNHDPRRHPILAKDGLTEAEAIAGTVAVVSGISGSVYFHWMVDVLPRLEILRQAGYNWQDIDRIVVNSIRHPFQRETLQRLGIPESQIVESDIHPHIQADQLLVPDFAGPVGYPPPWVLAWHRRTWLQEDTLGVNLNSEGFLELSDTQKSKLGQKTPKLIYISRHSAKYRRLLNEEAIAALLQQRGFITISPETLSVAEQAQVFSQAEVIVASHGSGLTNLIFCQPETTIIELMSPHYIRPYFWGLSRQLGLHHYYITGEALDCYPLRQLMYPTALTEDIWINPQTLLQLLDSVLTTDTASLPTPSQKHDLTQPSMSKVPMINFPNLSETALAAGFQKQAEFHLQSGDIHAAMAACEQALNHDPNSAVTCQLLGKVWQQRGDEYWSQYWYQRAQTLGYRESVVERKDPPPPPPQPESASQEKLEIPQTIAEPLSDMVAQVEANLQEKQFQQALSLCQQVLALDPETANIYALLGKALLGMKRLPEAVAAFEKAVQLNPEDATIHTNLGSLAARMQGWEQAIKCYERAIALQPDLVAAHRNLGKVWHKLGKPQQAVSCRYQALILQPEEGEVSEFLAVGNSLLQSGRLQEAEVCYRQVVRRSPHDSQAYHNLGEVLSAQGLWSEAEAAYRRAVELQPDSFESRNSLGQALVAQEKWDDAIACYGRALEQNPRLLMALENLSKALRHSNKSLPPSQARVLSLIAGGQIPEELPPPGGGAFAPPDVDVALERATELYQQKRYQACVQQCQQVVQWRPREARAYGIWGRALVGLGEYGKALRCYRKAIALEPKNGLWHQELGELCLQQRRYPEAIVSLQEAVKLKPHPRIYRSLASAWGSLGKEAEALDCLFEAIQAKPELASLGECLNLAQGLWRRGQKTQAIACYQVAVTTHPHSAKAHQQLAEALYDLGRQGEAMTYYRLCFELAERREPTPPRPIQPQRPWWERFPGFSWLGGHRRRLAPTPIGEDYKSQLPTSHHQILPSPPMAVLPPVQSVSSPVVDSQKPPQRRVEEPVTRQNHIPIGGVASAPPPGQPAWEEAIAAAGAENWQGCVDICRHLLDREPERLEVLQLLAQALEALEQWSDAAGVYQKAVALAPDDGEMWVHLGDVSVVMQAWSEAIVAYQRAVALVPDWVSVWEVLGDLELERENWSEAAGIYGRVLELNPGNWEVYQKLGDALQGWGRVDEAIEAFKKSKEYAYQETENNDNG
ncbi:tetratricopeptide repeat protein [Arthrospira platensis NCB002]|uniref:TPR domain protein n=3 Tax=Limnospira platensis TaxID=118562 RepID=A0A5M3T8L2_LIMPL|nr:tetratricopeptide repeat protein [Arthrospira platensis NCB002]BDT11207.1 TPR domain protein [Arthrospira platensis NIES-39]GCE94368.1 TPR domain protein [Arthrospira platensis NIES-46]